MVLTVWGTLPWLRNAVPGLNARQEDQGKRRPGGADGRRFDWACVESTMRRYQPDPHADYVADSIATWAFSSRCSRLALRGPG
jgi:hypothetical protein